MSGFIYEKNKENIVTITMDMQGPVNAINDEFSRLMEKYMDRLEQEKDQIDGVIITSAKSTFLAGGDLKAILSFEKGDEEKIFELLEDQVLFQEAGTTGQTRGCSDQRLSPRRGMRIGPVLPPQDTSEQS